MSQAYSFLDHNDILDSLTVYMKNQDVFKDFNFEGSAIKELLRVLAFNAQQQAFYNNFMYNELQLDSAQIPENVYSLASRIGYTPVSITSAKFTVNLVVTPPDISTAPSTLSLNRNVKFYTNVDNSTYIFSPADIYTTNLVNGVYTFNNVKLLQGTWNYASFVVQTTYGFESYAIADQNIDTSTLEVYVRSSESSADLTPFSVFKTAYDLGETNNVCFLRKNKDGFYELRFGDGSLATKLDYGNIITVKYVITDGEVGNNLSNLSLATSINGFYDVQITPVDTYSYGGSDEESVDSVRNLAPLVFSSSGKAVTAGDYVALTKDLYDDAGDVISWNGRDNDPPRPGYTYVAVKPKNSDTLSSQQKTDLTNLLNQYNVGSITPIIVDPEYIYINVDSTVKYDPKTLSTTESILTSKIQDYCYTFSTQKMEIFDGELDISKFSEFINAIDPSIKGNSTQVSYEKRLVPIVNAAGSYIMKFYHSIKESSVLITGFRVADADYSGWTYTIYDDGLGNLVMNKYNGSSINIIQSSIGSVDYDNGIVTLTKFMPNSILGDYLTITCNSKSYDQSITGLFNIILKMNQINVTLESSR